MFTFLYICSLKSSNVRINCFISPSPSQHLNKCGIFMISGVQFRFWLLVAIDNNYFNSQPALLRANSADSGQVNHMTENFSSSMFLIFQSDCKNLLEEMHSTGSSPGIWNSYFGVHSLHLYCIYCFTYMFNSSCMHGVVIERAKLVVFDLLISPSYCATVQIDFQT